jgi:hypothetical protein
VLNNSESVKAKNRERVLKAIAESNYQPNLLARQLRTARSSMILVLVSNIANPFCAEVVKGLKKKRKKRFSYPAVQYRFGHGALALGTQPAFRENRRRHHHHGRLLALAGTGDAYRQRPWVQCAEYADDGDVS